MKFEVKVGRSFDVGDDKGEKNDLNVVVSINHASDQNPFKNFWYLTIILLVAMFFVCFLVVVLYSWVTGDIHITKAIFLLVQAMVIKN
jgi:hypothetical protein